MNALIIGGDRHGEFVDVLDGAQTWVDIRSASTHRLRQITNVITDADGKVIEVWKLDLAVHQDALGPQEPGIVQNALVTLAMNAFTRAHGVQQEVPKEPAGADLIVPGQS